MNVSPGSPGHFHHAHIDILKRRAGVDEVLNAIERRLR